MNMVQIPYIEHEYRMYKAHQREKRLKMLLFATNFIWVISLAAFLILK